MQIQTLQKPTLPEFLNSFSILLDNSFTRALFRGQGDGNWDLIPSLFRLDPFEATMQNPNEFQLQSKVDQYRSIEEHLLNRFFDAGHAYIPNIVRNYDNDRIIAQHFGVPTSLLDWSRDPFVALYFAVENWDTGTDAAVFATPPTRSKVMFAGITVKEPNSFRVLEPPAIDGRIIAQKSALTDHTYEDANGNFTPFEERETASHSVHAAFANPVSSIKLIIPNNFKRELLIMLHNIGYDRRTLFPGLDGVGMWLNKSSTLYKNYL